MVELSQIFGLKYFTREYWNQKKQKKSDDEIRSSGVYLKLEGQLEESRRILGERESELSEAKLDFRVYESVVSTKLRERDAQISELEIKVCHEKEEIEKLEKLYLEVKAETKCSQRIVFENKRLRKKVISKSYQLINLRRELEEEKEKTEGRIEEIRFKERNERLNGIEKIARSYGVLKQAFAYESGMILKLNEKVLGGDKTAMVLLNNECVPIYATSAFYKTFDLSLATDLEKAPLMEETVRHAKMGNRQPFCISVKDNRKEGRFDVEILYARGNFGKPFGFFVLYTPQPGWFSKISHLHLGKSSVGKFVQENLIKPLEDSSQGPKINPV